MGLRVPSDQRIVASTTLGTQLRLHSDRGRCRPEELMTFHPREMAPEAGTIENPTGPPRSDGLSDDATFPDTSTESVQPIGSEPQRKRAGGTRAVREVVETLLLAVVIFVAVRLIVLNFRVDGSSMAPNLQNQEMLLVNRNVYFHFDLNDIRNLLPGDDREGEDIVYLFHPPERGDIVVFDPPVESPKPYIKRVIGLPGERVSIDNGFVYIDGQQLNEPYIDGAISECNRDACSWTVEDGQVFVMGDNRRNSSDSRMFGAIEVDDIIGKAWITYWPADEIDFVPHYDYPDLSD
jgi:signal peptidase I